MFGSAHVVPRQAWHGLAPLPLIPSAGTPPAGPLRLIPSPPHHALVRLPRRADTRRVFPCVLAPKPPVLLLLTTLPTRDPPDCGKLCTWRDNDDEEHTICIDLVPNPGYNVCDVSSATATATPVPDRRSYNDDLGIIATPGSSDHYMVTEF